ncbi:tRNA pseudouridine synthase A [Cohnella kolymensis]|uniref:tRNA pseudouridine synthase A n=1 Tax=Cohnella kolymensis TaxID=1590652 RepID=A0ABR5A7G1_9BACL|nr:tRNA pseudouridine(38-40) synthase TruA [Cohnella kolymensis]KIL36342.1 tRNA pseudouridine synthase A [Cohnella kolymensis]
MRNIGLIVSYDGTGYQGFQTQPGGNTIQNKLEEAIYLLSGESVRLIGSGRTDAGVHARGQVVNFHTSSSIPAERWERALNARLPDDIVVQSAFPAPLEFHSRRWAVRKTYRYSINCNRNPDLFRRHYQFHHHTPLNFEAMRSGLGHLLGEHDFSSFTSPQSTKPSHIRTIIDAKLVVEDNAEAFPEKPVLQAWDTKQYPGRQRGIVHLYITGNGFLYNMVRIITGTLIQVGEGKRSPDDMGIILAAKDRSKAGPTAVPHGLTLWEVEYEPFN